MAAERSEKSLQFWARLGQNLIATALIVSAAAIAVLAVWLVVSAQRAATERDVANDREVHTLNVLITATDMTRAMTDAQSAERGFLLTRNPVYLDRYEGGWTQAGNAFKTLATQTSDNRFQAVRLRDLQTLMKVRRGQMDELVRLAQRDELDENILVVRLGAGKTVMDQLREQILRITRTEQILLVERRAALRRAAARARDANNLVYALGLGTVALFTILLIAFIRQRQVAVNRAIEARAISRSAEVQKLLQLVIDSSDDPIYVKDREGRLIYVNRRVAQIYGADVDAVVGRTDFDFLPVEIATELRATDQAVIERGVQVTREEVVPEKGEPRIYSSAKAPWRQGGEIVGVIGISRDITELKREERRLQDSNIELEARVAERTVELTSAVSNLQREMADREAAETQVRQMQKMESIGQLSGGIAHDFNNMLAIVMGSLDLAKRRLAGDAHPGLIQNIDNAQEGARRAADLTARLLAYARRQPLAPQIADLNALVSDVCRVLERTLGDRIELEMLLAPAVGAVSIDVSQMESAIINVAVNARDAMPDGGRLIMATGSAAGKAWIRITDNGTGMSADVLAQAFDPFYTTKGVGKGTGMGLSQVQGFIGQSGGTVSIQSRPSKGTTVEISLPVTGITPASAAPAGLPVKSDGTSVRILVVEDEALVRKVAVATLEEEGHVVHEASDGEAALTLLTSESDVELMITDIAMPRMDGHELARRARALRPDLRIIFTTGYDATLSDKDSAVLQKPYLPGDLIDAVQKSLSRPA